MYYQFMGLVTRRDNEPLLAFLVARIPLESSAVQESRDMRVIYKDIYSSINIIKSINNPILIIKFSEVRPSARGI